MNLGYLLQYPSQKSRKRERKKLQFFLDRKKNNDDLHPIQPDYDRFDDTLLHNTLTDANFPFESNTLA